MLGVLDHDDWLWPIGRLKNLFESIRFEQAFGVMVHGVAPLSHKDARPLRARTACSLSPIILILRLSSVSRRGNRPGHVEISYQDHPDSEHPPPSSSIARTDFDEYDRSLAARRNPTKGGMTAASRLIGGSTIDRSSHGRQRRRHHGLRPCIRLFRGHRLDDGLGHGPTFQSNFVPQHRHEWARR